MRLAHALAGHLDEAELADAQHVGLGLVAAQRLLERLEDLVAVLLLLHVDEVADDDAADVAEPELVDDLLGRLGVDLRDRVLEVLLADVAAGVDVDGGERLGLVDDQVAAAVQPDLARGGALDLVLDAVGVEDRLVAVVEHDARPSSAGSCASTKRCTRSNSSRSSMMSFSTSWAKRSRVARKMRSRSGCSSPARWTFSVLLHGLVPHLDEEADVGLELLLRHVLGDGAHDEAGARGAQALDGVAQAAALLLVADAAADADVIDGRHEDEVPAGNGDVRGDARALGADGILRDLHQHFLADLEQILDLRCFLGGSDLRFSRSPRSPRSRSRSFSVVLEAHVARRLGARRLDAWLPPRDRRRDGRALRLDRGGDHLGSRRGHDSASAAGLRWRRAETAAATTSRRWGARLASATAGRDHLGARGHRRRRRRWARGSHLRGRETQRRSAHRQAVGRGRRRPGRRRRRSSDSPRAPRRRLRRCSPSVRSNWCRVTSGSKSTSPT